MSKVSLIAKLTCQDGKADEMEAALAGAIEAANSEAGLEIYSAHRGDDNIYWFFELYTDGDALKVHGKGDVMKTAMKAVGGCLAGAPEVSVLAPIAAKGLSL